VNGANEVMIATITSWPMVQNIHNAQLIVYPDVGHGAQFQYPDRFLKHSIQFQDA
jgi:pimeloyl-ACP methyl ester carboxylesterase